MAQLPTPGSDDGTWGDILNTFLLVSHNSDGTLQQGAITQAGGYVKPSSGIPATDLTSSVQSNLSAASTALQSGTAISGGDLSGSYGSPALSKIQGTAVNASTPANGQVLAYNSTSSAWVPATVSSTTVSDATTTSKGIIELAGDLGGVASGPSVLKVNGVSVTGTPTSGQVLKATSGTTASWQTASVTSVFGRTGAVVAQSGDYTASQVGALPSTDDLSTIATTNATAGDVSLNSHKLTNLANGTLSTDAATFGQIPTSLPPSGSAGGDLLGSYPNPTVARVNGVSVTGTPSSGQVLTASSSSAASWGALTNQAGPVVNVKDAAYGALGNNVHDDTTAIQNAINAANTLGAVVYFPAGQYRVSSLTLLSGTILQGVSSGTYPGNDSISGVSVLVRIASTNLDLLVAPDGNNYCRIYDMAIDGNKNNNTAGHGLYIADGASGQESQIIIERCYFQANPDSNLYLGHNRRANKVLNSVFNYSGAGDGITVAGSDNTIQGNICGSNARAGINLGTTVSQNWAAFGSNNNATTTHVVGNDIYSNLVGICIPSNATRSFIIGNGIDRNQYQGITVYNVDCNTIIGNLFHSNGQAANNTYGHIDIASGVTGIDIAQNTFGPLDGGFTNVCSYCVTLGSGLSAGVITGNIGVFDSSDTVGGLISQSGTNTSPNVTISKAGGIIQAAAYQSSSQNVFQVRNTSGTTMFQVTSGGSVQVLSGAGIFASTKNLWGGSNSNQAVSNAVATFLSPNSTTQQLATVSSSGQSANIATFYASDGATTLAQIDKSGGISVLGPTSASTNTAAARFAGGTTSGSPTSGTYLTGDYVIDQTGVIWICTAGGTPGTWNQVGSGGLTAPVTIATGNDANKALILKENSATQSADMLEVQDSGGSTHVSINSNYTLTLMTPTSTSGHTVLQTYRYQDTQPSFTMGERGFMSWGQGGSSATDTTLQRSSAGVLSVGSAIGVSGLGTATAGGRFVGATASGAPTGTGTTFAKGDFVIDQTGTIWICTTAGAPGTWTQISGGGSGATLGANTFTGNQTAPAFVASGLTGATAASRYVGATASGSPTSGTFAVGDFAIDQTGTVWICTTAGTPGTWTSASSAPPSLNMPYQLYGYLGWTFDSAAASGGSQLGTAGTVTLCKIPWPTTQTVTNIVVGLTAGGGTLTSGANFAGIYNSSGTLLGSTADQTSAWGSAGSTPKVMAISGGPISVTGGGSAGFIYVGILWNGTSSPSFYKATNGASALFNGSLSAATLRNAVNSSGNTTLPSSLTLSTSTASSNLIWAALS